MDGLHSWEKIGRPSCIPLLRLKILEQMKISPRGMLWEGMELFLFLKTMAVL